MRDIAIAIPSSDLVRTISQAVGEYEPLELSRVSRCALDIEEGAGR